MGNTHIVRNLYRNDDSWMTVRYDRKPLTPPRTYAVSA